MTSPGTYGAILSRSAIQHRAKEALKNRHLKEFNQTMTILLESGDYTSRQKARGRAMTILTRRHPEEWRETYRMLMKAHGK